VIAFIVMLVASATEFSAGSTAAANSIAVYAFYSLVVGVALQVASYLRYGEAGTESPRGVSPEPATVRMPTTMPLRTKVAAVAAVGLILLAAVVIGYPGLLRGGQTAVGTSSTLSSLPPSGCGGPRDAGTLFITTNTTVTIEICGQSVPIQVGARGGVIYSYPAGLVSFSAPSSANGSAFEFWYAIVGTNSPQRVNNTTLTLNLPAGLASQSSLIQLYYAAPPSPARSSTAANSTPPHHQRQHRHLQRSPQPPQPPQLRPTPPQPRRAPPRLRPSAEATTEAYSCRPTSKPPS
jgi:hypothetical protein